MRIPLPAIHASRLMRLFREERGASAVEFAIVAPILILLVFGMVQFAIAWNRTQGLQAAAREGARLASVGAPYADIVGRVGATQSLFQSGHLVVTAWNSTDNGATWSSATLKPCASYGSLVEIRIAVASSVQSTYGVAIPLFGTLPINFQSSGQFRCEQVTS